MKVVALGGSAAGTNTGAGSAGFLVVHESTSVVFDLGPGTLPELRKHVDVHTLTAIVITHYHLDHLLDLGPLRYLLAYGPRRPERRIPLFIPPGAQGYFELWSETFGHGASPDFLDVAFDVATYDPSAGLRMGELAVEMAPTVHPVQGWAMRVRNPTGLDFGYTADTGPAANLHDHFRDVGLLAAEATELTTPDDEPYDKRGHMTALEAGTLASKANARALMLTHMWEEHGLERAAAEAASVFRGPILLARPGLSVFL